MLDLLRRLFSSDMFMPHGHCYRWLAGLLWLHVLSDTAIGVAYMAISLTLVYMVLRIKGLPFQWVYLAFGVFIVACGFTHFAEVWTVWAPAYWLAGALKALTALASVGTALLLPPLVPRALALVEAAQKTHEQGEKLTAACAELSALYQKTSEVEQLKTRFFASVSHELRTPLTLILGPLERILNGAGHVDGEARCDLEIARRNARILLKHVNDLLDVSRLDAGMLAPGYAAVDLADLLRRVAGHFETVARDQRIELLVTAPPALPAEADGEQLQRVLFNLLGNAFKFTPEGGRILCALTAGEERATIMVADSGPGVPPEARAIIFERFRQGAGEPDRRFGGTGLGLAIAREFVTLHLGTIEVGDGPLGGAAFTVGLPLRAPASSAAFTVGLPLRAPASSAVAAQQAATSDVEMAAPAPRPAGGGQEIAALAGAAPAEVPAPEVAEGAGPREDRALVLVVEDNHDMSRFIARALSREHRVEVARDGEEGLRLARALRPDLLLSDMMMPRMTGEELLRAVKDEPALAGLPVVLLTAKADDEMRVRVLRAGAADYVMKPFSQEELLARVGNLVAMKRVRDLLQTELASQEHDLEALAGELAGKRRELEGVLCALRVTCEQAERASQVKGHFLSLISHELRTPLTTLGLQLQLLRRDREGTLLPRQREAVRRMERSLERMMAMIDGLLLYTQAESGRLTLRPASIEPLALAMEVIEEATPEAEEKGLRLRLLAEGTVPGLVSDPQLVKLVLGNLVQNAVKFTATGEVRVLLSHDPALGAHVLAVEDTGPGIPQEAQPAVFQPFSQLESIRHKHTPGIGLGLALVREMLDALGGEISLRSQVGSGSVFTVTLPDHLPVAAALLATALSRPPSAEQ